MATPNYFSYLPNITYAIGVDNAGHTNDIILKDYYRLMRLTDESFREATLYNQYVVKNGERPDQISYDTYGDEQYYWVILQINNIIDFSKGWPLSNEELETYIINKYGSIEASSSVSHWETQEVTDEEGNVVLESGLVVPEDFIFYYYPDPAETTMLSSFPTSVSYSEHERRLNEDKETIILLDKKYIYDYVREYRNWAKELPNTESQTGIYDAIR